MNSQTDISTEQQPAVRMSEYGPGILLMTLDTPQKGANILSREMFAQLDEAITPLLARDDILGLILYSAKPRIFVAGADLIAISQTLDWPDDDIIKFCDEGRAVMAKFSQTPFPTVAAVHGACVGGGLELTLWCDQRIASDDRCTILGLPETKLGLVPGWAGTIRVARICEATGSQHPLEHQIDLVVSGKVVNGTQAAEMGFVDDVVSQESLLAAAAERVAREFESGKYLSDRDRIASPMNVEIDNDALGAKWRTTIDENIAIFPFAPTVALEHMLRAANLPMKEACDSESLAMAQVYGSPASRGLINNFFLAERNRKNPGFVDLSLTPQPIDDVGIVGAGVMGQAIAANNLQRRKTVSLMDANLDTVRGVVDELSASFDTISTAEDYDSFRNCQLVIECAVEDPDIKVTILKQIETTVSREAILATNTSAIPIANMADSLCHPDRFCGLHFCNPRVMALVEIIKGPQSSEQTISTAVGYVRSVGKIPVVVKDRAGFVVNRLLSALLNQSIQLFVEGHSIESIDTALREFGFLVGPFEIIDIIGADTCYNAGRAMWIAGLRCVSESLILPRMVKLGRVGHKAGCGFYAYDPDFYSPKHPSKHSAKQKQSSVDPETMKQLSPYRTRETAPDAPLEEGVHRILAGVVLEATHILEENIVSDFRDIDLCAIHGFSFPAEHGGLLFWADRFGIKNVVNLLERQSNRDPHLTPTARLIEMAAKGLTFYSS